MANEIKIRLLSLGKRQVDLLSELRKCGFPCANQSSLSRCVNGVDQTPSALAMKETIYRILDEWNKTA